MLSQNLDLKEKMSRGKIYCLISAVIIFGAYVSQRVLNIVTEPSRTSVLIQAMVFTLLTAIVYFLISQSNEPFYGILTALFGIRLLPVDIPQLEQFSAGADIVYFLVSKVTFIIFAIAIIRLYRLQNKGNSLTSLPIICAIVIVPFFNEINTVVASYVASISNGNMLYSYFIGFAVYSASLLCLLFVALRSNNMGARLICDFQLVALLLGAGRRACAIIINTVQGNHISRSYYCYIAIYVVFFIAFFILRKKRCEAQKLNGAE